jgi:NAD(P)-dependent dehydrogenase (short-subunit alcohol dehydrogenase family)
LAAAIRRDHQRLDVLINIAGIGTARAHGSTARGADDRELRLAINYLGTFC